MEKNLNICVYIYIYTCVQLSIGDARWGWIARNHIMITRSLRMESSQEQQSGDIEESQWHPTPVLLPGKSHGWRSLVGCCLWGRWELDMTEWLHFHFSLSSIGEGNGNPLQCSCLENPKNEGAWWAAIYGVAQSWTWPKWLSSSSSVQ